MFSVRSDKDVPVYVDMLLCLPNGSHCELRLLLSILISLSYCWEFTLLIKRVAGGDKCNEPVKKINIRAAAPISHLLSSNFPLDVRDTNEAQQTSTV